MDRLAPILAAVYNMWLRACVVPASFGTTNIQCLKKTPAAKARLDHCPIALLNSDYKVFSRISATRLRPKLKELLHSLQAGFVTDDNIATPIQTFLALQQLAVTDTKLVVLLLDFAKVYDSLSRAFLYSVLWH